MIEIKNLVKHYGQVVAVDDISFKVKEGEILGFLGPNGSGKSTTMNIITGYLPSTSGTVEVAGYDITTHPEEVKKRIGYLPEQPPLYKDMTVTEYLSFVSDLKKAPKSKKKSELSDIMELVGLTDHRKRLIDNLSKGYRQRVGLAQALVGNPKVLILDEPTVGLDPKQIVEIRRVIKGLATDRTIILSTHILPEVSMICERVVIINKGKIVAEDTPDRLSASLSKIAKLNLTVKGDKDKVLKTLGNIPNVRYVTMTTKAEDSVFKYVLETGSDKDIREEIFYKMAEIKAPILEIRPTAATLEDIFISVVSSDGIKHTEEE
ncbi:MAG TPA: ATP-binding cassette domain-containing protein [Clostridia bacterium]|nr:ATP-binding cassette domain-containing protein [Clostridiaceae bacterium]HOF26392.1 ATP-binding cassette domain-containing protein [Clostridia bacterium]HOM34201.1 ATP-binding cassette domain-containing protein [Clostridia bacterium]HOR89751.1 ATP-binding cassette domain-containing protein [Clostridia bacterium]HPL08009.1 ATP-binding cassette domain-containing protein [Clostridia bacterium]